MKHAPRRPRVPFGYRPGTGALPSVPVPDERLARYIRAVFATAAKNRRALYDLSRELAGEGFVTRAGTPYPVSFLIRLLRNPFYAGYARRGGRQVRGAHRAIVDRPTFHYVRHLYCPGDGLVGQVVGSCVRIAWRLTRPWIPAGDRPVPASARKMPR